MKRTVWIIAATLALGTGVGCKDSNQNYIGFDASTSDVKADVGASDVKADASAADGSVSDGATSDGTGDASTPDRAPEIGPADSASVDTGLDTSIGIDGAADTTDAEQG